MIKEKQNEKCHLHHVRTQSLNPPPWSPCRHTLKLDISANEIKQVSSELDTNMNTSLVMKHAIDDDVNNGGGGG